MPSPNNTISSFLFFFASIILSIRAPTKCPLIESNLSEHPEESRQLKEIIEEWANLKVEAFENRRSWVRAAPSK